MSYFNAAKNDKDIKPSAEPARLQPAMPSHPVNRTPENVSTLASGMQVTGNIVCTGPLQIYGRVVGDIHAAQLTICEGARVEGKIVAPEAIIQGSFNGSIHGNIVKLQKTASVEGEIFNRSLAIEQDARFEGVARRIDQPVVAPGSEQMAAKPAAAAPLELRAEQQAPAVAPLA